MTHLFPSLRPGRFRTGQSPRKLLRWRKGRLASCRCRTRQRSARCPCRPCPLPARLGLENRLGAPCRAVAWRRAPYLGTRRQLRRNQRSDNLRWRPQSCRALRASGVHRPGARVRRPLHRAGGPVDALHIASLPWRHLVSDKRLLASLEAGIVAEKRLIEARAVAKFLSNRVTGR